MPLIDMPLAELGSEPGRNPRPADFDQYWACALTELQGTDPQVELKPYALPAKRRNVSTGFHRGRWGARPCQVPATRRAAMSHMAPC